jgi:cytochrome c-type biogenesis protein CcmH
LRWSALALIAAALSALALAAAPASAAEPQTNLPDIEDEVMCPVCGTLLELSGAPQAEREREFIRGLIAQGKSKNEVEDALVAEYGEDVLATPDSGGFDLTAWVIPALGIALGVGGVGVAIARLARRRGPAPSAPEIEPAEAARLDRDMSSYDL